MMTLARKSEDIVLSLVIQALFFGEIPDALALIGAAIILGCIMAAGMRKIVQEKVKGREM